MLNLAPADELAEIRAEIARLKLREAALRAQFLADPTGKTKGRWHRVEVEERGESRFNPALLPAEIVQDPRYREQRQVQTVRCLPLPLTVALRPGWPIRRDRRSLH